MFGADDEEFRCDWSSPPATPLDESSIASVPYPIGARLAGYDVKGALGV